MVVMVMRRVEYPPQRPRHHVVMVVMMMVVMVLRDLRTLARRCPVPSLGRKPYIIGLQGDNGVRNGIEKIPITRRRCHGTRRGRRGGLGGTQGRQCGGGAE